MRDKNKKHTDETGTAFALNIFLTNLLLAVLLGAVVWIMYSAVSGNNEFYMFFPGAGLPYSL